MPSIQLTIEDGHCIIRCVNNIIRDPTTIYGTPDGIGESDVIIVIHKSDGTLDSYTIAKHVHNSVYPLEDERNIHQMLTSQLERNRDLLFRKKRDQAIANLTKADVDQAIKKYIHLDQLVEVMADQYGQPND